MPTFYSQPRLPTYKQLNNNNYHFIPPREPHKRGHTLSAHTQKNKNTQTSETIIWQDSYLVTDTVQYLQVLTLIKCDQENGLAPPFPVILLFFIFPSLKPRATLAGPWFTPLLSLLGAAWSKDRPGPQQSTGGNTAKTPGHAPCPGPQRTFIKASSPNTSRNPSAASRLGFSGLASKSSSFKEQPIPAPPAFILYSHCETGHFRIQGKLRLRVSAHGTQGILSLAATMKQNHVHI